MLQSFCTTLCDVQLPYKARRDYMHTFDIENPVMKPGYEDYGRIVSALLQSAHVTHGKAHMTVDEQIVKAGRSHRRPGPHVDGCFIPSANYWGHPSPGWLHYYNNVGRGPIARMAVIVASSVPGCKVWEGIFDGEPTKTGDLSHIVDQLGEGIVLPSDRGFLLSPDCVHESVIFPRDTVRTFLRIALPTTR
jgi:hypothetical protein